MLIRVKAVGVNPVDTFIRSGSFGPLDFPAILGFDVAGIVHEVGSAVKGFKVRRSTVIACNNLVQLFNWNSLVLSHDFYTTMLY